MPSISTVMKSLGDDIAETIKDELKSLLTGAKDDSLDLIRETGERISDWIVMRAKGELSDAEFESLLFSRDRLLRQHKNTLQIETLARFEKIAVGLVNLVLDKILGIAFGGASGGA